eukprot:754931-Hanusia_phi.AAC.5
MEAIVIGDEVSKNMYHPHPLLSPLEPPPYCVPSTPGGVLIKHGDEGDENGADEEEWEERWTKRRRRGGKKRKIRGDDDE